MINFGIDIYYRMLKLKTFMKKYIPLFFTLFLFACGGNDTVPNEVITDSTEMQTSTTEILDANYYWSADADSSGDIKIRKVRPIAPDSLNYPSMIAMINSVYPEVKLEAEKLAGDTLYLNIADSKFLTNGMGSAGAFYYLQEATYNLTEVKGIHYVNFNFKEGDHAAPGLYDRSRFVQSPN